MTDTVDPLIEQLGNKKWWVRRAAAQALGKPGNSDAVGLLIKALGDEDKGVRYYAIIALTKIGASAIEPLCRALESRDKNFGYEIVVALGRAGELCAVEPLCKAVWDTDRSVRYSAASTLFHLGNPDVLPRRILVSDKMTMQARVAALNALSAKGEYYHDGISCRYGTPNARQLCKKLRADTDPDIRQAAEAMWRYLENRLPVPSQRTETDTQDELLRASPGQMNDETRDTLLRASEASETIEHRKPSLWKRLFGKG